MRGKGSAPPRGHPLPGITPAYAGKSNALLNLPAGQRDHPRVCGEKEAAALSEVYETGSPPRMRGKDRQIVVCAHCPGITPAYAGKRTMFLINLWLLGDHPRVCGEKVICKAHLLTVKGSPPRMRGKVVSSQVYSSRIGITPAYAGKRLKRSHSIGHFSCILCLFHSVLHRASASGGSRAGPCAPPCLPAQNAVPV